MTTKIITAFLFSLLLGQVSNAASVCILHSAQSYVVCDGKATTVPIPGDAGDVISQTAALKTMLDQGYKIVSESSDNGYARYTLVK